MPTTNFVLHWITGRTEAHRYDESLRSIDLVTKDAYEPLLPLSVVVHIDYQKAPSVIQRFGDVKKLITQTLDPMLSAYFRDVAHKKTMLELLQERDEIQQEAREELRGKFREFDIECVDVLIGKPDTAEAGGKIETLLEQLRLRQLSIEQIETYERQRAAAEKLRTLNEAQAQAAMQTQLTNSQVQVRIAENQGEAELARARKQAEQMVVTAQAESQQRVLAGRGEGSRILQVGLSEASVLLRKIQSFGDPRLYALSLVAEQLAHSSQPLVPERVFMAGAQRHRRRRPRRRGQPGLLGLLINLLVAEKSGFQLADTGASLGPAGVRRPDGQAGDGIDAASRRVETGALQRLPPPRHPRPFGTDRGHGHARLSLRAEQKARWPGRDAGLASAVVVRSPRCRCHGHGGRDRRIQLCANGELIARRGSSVSVRRGARLDGPASQYLTDASPEIRGTSRCAGPMILRRPVTVRPSALTTSRQSPRGSCETSSTRAVFLPEGTSTEDRRVQGVRGSTECVRRTPRRPKCSMRRAMPRSSDARVEKPGVNSSRTDEGKGDGANSYAFQTFCALCPDLKYEISDFQSADRAHEIPGIRIRRRRGPSGTIPRGTR